MANLPKSSVRKLIKAWKKDTRHERALKHIQLATLLKRRQERQLLDTVLSSKVIYNGGFTPRQSRRLQKALRIPKTLPSTETSIADDQKRRERAVAKLEV
ncbi:MAG: hypothetical protein HETSPECPRED_005376 [Heterodermia speciosa]|uniref:Uncharacterized protein n=1 Tax=Heterodermia speciosa TaxID=116794 RepID=A0A8H3FHH3_9LECA|nr:MAG: hypothetical protein HETSPECPRED_005376 [Heterodermia speciosa]